jgi:hypothetical protein
MSSETEVSKNGRSRKKVIIISVLGILLLLILAVLVFPPVYISSAAGNRLILSKINESVDGQVDFSDLSMGWFSGVTVSDVTFRDEIGGTSVNIKRISTKPHYASLLRGRVSFGPTVIEEPAIEIKLDRQKLRIEVEGEEVIAEGNGDEFGLPLDRLDLSIKEGSFKVFDADHGTVELSRINSDIKLRPMGQKSVFAVNMAVVSQGKESPIKVAGDVEVKGWGLEDIHGEVTVEIDDLELASLAPLLALAGVELEVRGKVTADIDTKIEDGHISRSVGNIRGSDIFLGGADLGGDSISTKELNVDIDLHGTKEAIEIKKLEVSTDWAKASIKGKVPANIEMPLDKSVLEEDFDLSGDIDVDLAAVLSQMPNTLGLKEGSSFTSGRAKVHVETLGAVGSKKIVAQAEVVGLKGVVDGKHVSLDEPVNAAVEVDLGREKIYYEKIEFTSSFMQVTASGSSEALNYLATADFAKLQKEVSQFVDMGGWKLSGQVTEKGVISGDKNKVTAVGQAEFKDIDIVRTDAKGTARVSEPSMLMKFDMSVLPKEKVISIANLETTASFGRIGTKDAVLPYGEEKVKPLNAVVFANIDLAKMRDYAVMFGGMNKDIQLAGEVDSQIVVTGQNDTYRLKTDSTKIRGLKVAKAGQEPFEQDEVTFVCDGSVNTREKSFAAKWELLSPQIKIRGNLSNKKTNGENKLDGSASGEYDWSAISAMLSAFLPAGLVIEGRRESNFVFASQYRPDEEGDLMANLNADGQIGFDRASYMGLNFGPTEVKPQFRQGILDIAKFTTQVNKGSLSFGGRADFTQRPSFLRAEEPMDIARNIQIDTEMTKKLLQYVNPIFVNALNPSGVLNFRSERIVIPLNEVRKDDIVVDGTISLKARLGTSGLLGQILTLIGVGGRQANIVIHPTRIVLENGFLSYDKMQMDIDNYPVVFQGRIGLDKSLDMKVTLPITYTGDIIRADDTSGARGVTLPIKGTLDKNKIDTSKLIEEGVKGLLEEEIRKGLEGLFK